VVRQAGGEERRHHQPWRRGHARGEWRVDSGARLREVASSSPTATSPLHHCTASSRTAPWGHLRKGIGRSTRGEARLMYWFYTVCFAQRSLRKSAQSSDHPLVGNFAGWCRTVRHGTRPGITTSDLCARCLGPWRRSVRRWTLLHEAGDAPDSIARAGKGRQGTKTRDKDPAVPLDDSM
jgi:hypothetical protein